MCVCIWMNGWIKSLYSTVKWFPGYLSEKSSLQSIAWKSYVTITCLKSEGRSVVSDSLWPHGLFSPCNSPGENTGTGSLCLLQGIFPTWGLNPRSSAFQVDSLPAEPQGKPKNSGVGSFSLLQGIFPTQGLNPRSSALQVDSLPAEPQGNPKNSGVGSFSLLQGIFPIQGSNPRSPALQVDSLPDEPQGKPKNSGGGSLSLLQWIFLTQELNWGLLHCWWILYQLSY